jgi:hypothetical protein
MLLAAVALGSRRRKSFPLVGLFVRSFLCWERSQATFVPLHYAACFHRVFEVRTNMSRSACGLSAATSALHWTRYEMDISGEPVELGDDQRGLAFLAEAMARRVPADGCGCRASFGELASQLPASARKMAHEGFAGFAACVSSRHGAGTIV